MIKYFDELEQLNNYKVYIMQHNTIYDVDKPISIDFYKKYHFLFDIIKDINEMVELKLIRGTYNRKDEDNYLKQINIVNMIKEKYLSKDKDNYENTQELYNLLINDKYEKVLKLLCKINDLSGNELKTIIYFYKSFIEIVNPYQNKDILNIFELAYSDLNKGNRLIYEKNYQPIILPSYWYILPKFHELDERLYNTTGEKGHKEANLIYPYFKALDGFLIDYREFISKVKEIEKDGVSLRDYLFFVKYGIGYFPNILDSNDMTYEIKSHIKNNILITTGCVMAQGLLWEYFGNLKKQTTDYMSALDSLKNIILDDFLIRFVGFHKIILRNNSRIISTSSLNYHEEFSEYERNGWNIDFTMPLQINHITNKVEELDDSFIKMKQFHMD